MLEDEEYEEDKEDKEDKEEIYYCTEDGKEACNPYEKVGDNLWRIQRTMNLVKWVEKGGLPKPYKLEEYLNSNYYRE